MYLAGLLKNIGVRNEGHATFAQVVLPVVTLAPRLSLRGFSVSYPSRDRGQHFQANKLGSKELIRAVHQLQRRFRSLSMGRVPSLGSPFPP